MEPTEPLHGVAPFTITTQSEWIIWNSNGANYASGANGDNEANGESLETNCDNCAINSIGDNGYSKSLATMEPIRKK